jgi:hypothetical protein
MTFLNASKSPVPLVICEFLKICVGLTWFPKSTVPTVEAVPGRVFSAFRLDSPMFGVGISSETTRLVITKLTAGCLNLVLFLVFGEGAAWWSDNRTFEPL